MSEGTMTNKIKRGSEGTMTNKINERGNNDKQN